MKAELAVTEWAPATSCQPAPSREVPAQGVVRGTALLLHGISGSPEEMMPLAKALAARGYRSVIPLLSGHCSTLRALGAVSLKTWQQQSATLLQQLSAQSTHGTIVVVGLSFGSLLSLWLARERPQLISELVVLSPPLRLRSSRLELLHRFLTALPEGLLGYLGTRAKSRRPKGYLALPHNAHPRHSIGAAERALRLRDSILSRPPTWTKPILVAIDPQDHLVNTPWVAKWLIRHYPQARIEEFHGGQHELPLGHQSDRISQVICDHLAASALK